MLATQLSSATGRVVENDTNPDGKYDFVLDWLPDNKDPDPSDQRPSINTALVEQLGLRLDQARRPVKTVAVDRVDRPSAN